MLNLENCLLEFNRNKNGDKDQSPEVLMKAANNAIFDLVEVNSKYRRVLTSIQHCYSEVFTKLTLDERKRTKALKNQFSKDLNREKKKLADNLIRES